VVKVERPGGDNMRHVFADLKNDIGANPTFEVDNRGKRGVVLDITKPGARDALAKLAEEPVPGTRVIPLQVAGAFHTRYMRPAVDRLAVVAAELDVSDPGITLWTNRDGTVVSSGREFVDLLVGQVSSPVRWDRDMASFASAGVTGLIEVAPAGALVGLAKRALKGVPTVAVKSPDDLPAAMELIEQAAA